MVKGEAIYRVISLVLIFTFTLSSVPSYALSDVSDSMLAPPLATQLQNPATKPEWTFEIMERRIARTLKFARDHKLKKPEEILISLLKKDLGSRSAADKKLSESYDIDGIKAIRDDKGKVIAFSLPIIKKEGNIFWRIYNFEAGDRAIKLTSGTDVYVRIQYSEDEKTARVLNELVFLRHDAENALAGPYTMLVMFYEKHNYLTPELRELFGFINEAREFIIDLDIIIHEEPHRLREGLEKLNLIVKKSHSYFDQVNLKSVFEEAYQKFEDKDKNEENYDVFVRGAISGLLYLKNLLSDYSPGFREPPKVLSLNTLIDSVWRLEYIIAEKGKRSYGAGDVKIFTDEAALTRALANIIINAGNAIERNGEKGEFFLHTALTGDGKHVEIILSDTAGGIPAEILPHIFEKGFTTKRKKGIVAREHGLGLAIAKDYIENRCHGTISVESEPGKGLPAEANLDTTHSQAKAGTIFTIRLPLAGEVKVAAGSPAECLKTILNDEGLRKSTAISTRKDLYLKRLKKSHGGLFYSLGAIRNEVKMLKDCGILIEGDKPYTCKLRPELQDIPPPAIDEICNIEINGIRWLRRSVIPKEILARLKPMVEEIMQRYTINDKADVLLDWDITPRCNLKCEICYGPNTNIHEPTLNECKQLVSQLKEAGVEFLTLCGGEPLVRDDIAEIMRLVNDTGVKINLNTNGVLLMDKWKQIEPYLFILGIGLDGSTPEIDSLMRGGELHYGKVIEFLEFASKNKIKPKIKIGTVVTKKNLHDLEDLGKLLRQYPFISFWRVAQFNPRGRGLLHKKELEVSDKEYNEVVGKLKREFPDIKISTRSSKDVDMGCLILESDSILFTPLGQGQLVIGKFDGSNLKELVEKGRLINDKSRISRDFLTAVNYNCHSCTEIGVKGEETVLCETDNFKVLLDPHPIAEGHMVIYPKAHVLSMSLLDEDKLNELEEVHLFIKGILEKAYGKEVVFFEHGSTASDEKRVMQGGNSIVHAHLHAIPVPAGFDILSTFEDTSKYNLKPIKSFNGLVNERSLESAYFFYEDTTGNKYAVGLDKSYAAPSQFLRIVIAEKLGNAGMGNWKLADSKAKAQYDQWFDRARNSIPAFNVRSESEKEEVKARVPAREAKPAIERIAELLENPGTDEEIIKLAADEIMKNEALADEVARLLIDAATKGKISEKRAINIGGKIYIKVLVKKDCPQSLSKIELALDIDKLSRLSTAELNLIRIANEGSEIAHCLYSHTGLVDELIKGSESLSRTLLSCPEYRALKKRDSGFQWKHAAIDGATCFLSPNKASLCISEKVRFFKMFLPAIVDFKNKVITLESKADNERIREELSSLIRILDITEKKILAYINLVDTNKMQKEELVDIAKIASSLADMIRSPAERSKYSVVTSFEKDMPFVKGSPSALQQILLSVIDGAFTAIEDAKSSELKISTTKENDKIVIRVSGNYTGKVGRAKKRAAAPFALREEWEDTGLALERAEETAKELGGTIEVVSEAGKGLPAEANLDTMHSQAKAGTIFTIRLPLALSKGSGRADLAAAHKKAIDNLGLPPGTRFKDVFKAADDANVAGFVKPVSSYRDFMREINGSSMPLATDPLSARAISDLSLGALVDLEETVAGVSKKSRLMQIFDSMDRNDYGDKEDDRSDEDDQLDSDGHEELTSTAPDLARDSLEKYFNLPRRTGNYDLPNIAGTVLKNRILKPFRNDTYINRSYEATKILLSMTNDEREKLLNHISEFYKYYDNYGRLWHVSLKDATNYFGDRHIIFLKNVIYLAKMSENLDAIRTILKEKGFEKCIKLPAKIDYALRDGIFLKMREYAAKYPFDDIDIPSSSFRWYSDSLNALEYKKVGKKPFYEHSEPLSPFWQIISGLEEKKRYGEFTDSLKERAETFEALASALVKEKQDRLIGLPKRVLPDMEELLFAFCGIDMINNGNYSIPDGTEEPGIIQLKGLWNPVAGISEDMDKMDIDIGGDSNFFGVTGQNEVGKSTTIDAIAIAVIYYQMGIPIPAESGKISVFRNIYTTAPGFEKPEPGESTHTRLVKRLMELISRVEPRDLVIIDEAHMGSDYKDLTAVTSVLMKRLIATGATVVYATHLKSAMTIIADSVKHGKPRQIVFKEDGGIRERVLIPGIAEHSLSTATMDGIGFPAEVIQWQKEYYDAIARRESIAAAPQEKITVKRKRLVNLSEDEREEDIARRNEKLAEEAVSRLFPARNFYYGFFINDGSYKKEDIEKWLVLPDLDKMREKLFETPDIYGIRPGNTGDVWKCLEALNEMKQAICNNIEHKEAILKDMVSSGLIEQDGRFKEMIRRMGDWKDFIKKSYTEDDFTVYIHKKDTKDQWEKVLETDPNAIRRIFGRLEGDTKNSYNRMMGDLKNTRLGDIDFFSGVAVSVRGKDMHFVKYLDKGGSFSIRNARSPIIHSDKVVPIGLVGDSAHPQLIITGPQKSGKTEAIRTLLALVYLAKKNLPVPAEMEIPRYDKVLTFFGGEENMVKGESYFKSVARYLKFILKNATSDSLVIMDELQGSDYWELSALQAAVIKYLDRIGATVVLNTHMREGLSVAKDIPSIKFLKTDVAVDKDGKITYSYSISADDKLESKSYGVETLREIVPPDIYQEMLDARRKLEKEEKAAGQEDKTESVPPSAGQRLPGGMVAKKFFEKNPERYWLNYWDLSIVETESHPFADMPNITVMICGLGGDSVNLDVIDSADTDNKRPMPCFIIHAYFGEGEKEITLEADNSLPQEHALQKALPLIREKIIKIATALDIPFRDLTEEIVATPESERANAERFTDAVKVVQAQEAGRPTIVVLGTSWIKGYERDGDGRSFRYLQGKDLNNLVTSTRNYCESRGMPFIAASDDKLLGLIAAEKSKAGMENAKVIVLAGEDTVKSDEFAELRNNEKNAFVVGVNNQDLVADNYIRLMEMFTIALRLSVGMEASLNGTPIKIIKDDKYNIYILFPPAEPMKYEEQEPLYKIQIFA